MSFLIKLKHQITIHLLDGASKVRAKRENTGVTHPSWWILTKFRILKNKMQMENFASDACWRLIPGLHISPCWILIFTSTFSFISLPTYRAQPFPPSMWSKWKCVINYAAISHNHEKPDKHRYRDKKAITSAIWGQPTLIISLSLSWRKGKKKKKNPTCIHSLHYSAISSSFIRTWHFNLFHSLEAETLKAFCQLKCVSDWEKKGIKKKTLIYTWFI